MQQWLNYLLDILNSPAAWNVVEAAFKIVLGVILGRIAGKTLVRIFARPEDLHRAIILRRLSLYTITGLFTASALMGLGFDLGVLLGAAGILTVAIGFASQTSASNVISGLFLLGERPFAVGDIIRVNQTVGEVLSIDLLSVKLRTFENLFVRIPNETVIKSEVTNLRHFPIRRVDIEVGVAYKEDLRFVREILLDVADRNPLCLEEPAPSILFQMFGDSSIDHTLRVWAKSENFLALRNSIPVEIKQAFDRHGIEIPFPHRTLYTGSETTPFPFESHPANGTSTQVPVST
ncbi:MAG: mechanosensitive ion channel protein [Bacteroidetes bacterium CG12_big_fil_rev_8_21_14_0_65_60_17]|nr:MAG: mechanosensitive ion channel protein [Bacteroidetes bacterium CG12_big_fil_rev_8_21_14_0_65_60_17]